MTTEQHTTIDRIAAHVKQKLEGEGSGHDWWHIVRVWNMAKRIGEKEKADLFVVELAALLHDIADWKFHDGDDSMGPKVARELLEQEHVTEDVIAHVCDIISTISYKGAGVKIEMKSLEGKVAQDADRLDAIGAIGIGRAFAYGGHTGRLMYDPNEKPVLHQTKEAYMKNTGATISHFYEKLLLLKDRMNTNAARAIAEARHAYMETFLQEFFAEWNGER